LTTNNQSSTGSEISIEENKNNHRGTNKQEIINGYSILISLFILAGLSWFFWDDIKTFVSSITPKPDLGGDEDILPDLVDIKDEYDKYFKEMDSHQELYDLELIRHHSNKIDYLDVENSKWLDSPTTPKASTSKLPYTHGVMVPISKK